MQLKRIGEVTGLGVFALAAVLMQSCGKAPSPEPSLREQSAPVTAADAFPSPSPASLAPLKPAPPRSTDTPEQIRARALITQQAIANLSETLAELRRKGKSQEVAMVEQKQAELRAAIVQANDNLRAMGAPPIADP
ncbi:MAG TPA: hypothetical protein VNO55_27660 [Polyangia bacterium]|nr:hypothetical protein [Polyangia bacterium]